MKGVQSDRLWGHPNPASSALKRWKRRNERRRAKKNPECGASYTKFKGWYW